MFVFKCRVQIKVFANGKADFIDFLRDFSSSEPMIGDAGVSPSDAAMRVKKDEYVWKSELPCRNIGPGKMGCSLVLRLITDKFLKTPMVR